MNKLLSALILLVAFGNAAAQPAVGTSALDWAKKKCTDIGFKAGTERFGNCVLQLSKNEDAASSAPKQTASPVAQVSKKQTSEVVKSFKDCDECPEMVVIPSGKFVMGSKDDPFAPLISSADEMPQHEVSIKSFALGKFEVTQEQWFLIMGTTPSRFRGRYLPVDNISWDDAQEFVKKLSIKTGKNYRLPTEAEWEYAARAGSQTLFSWGDDLNASTQFAWSALNSDREPHPVGEKLPNKFGLYDMSGNVLEWTQDCWNTTYLNAPIDGSAWGTGDCLIRSIRGGGWGRTNESLKVSYRFSSLARIKSEGHGLRVARDN